MTCKHLTCLTGVISVFKKTGEEILHHRHYHCHLTCFTGVISVLEKTGEEVLHHYHRHLTCLTGVISVLEEAGEEVLGQQLLLRCVTLPVASF